MEHRLSGKARSHTGLGFTPPMPLDMEGEGSGRLGEDGRESSGEDKIKVSLSLSVYLTAYHWIYSQRVVIVKVDATFSS